MLTPSEKRQYEALAAKMRGPKVKIQGTTLQVGKDKVQLPSSQLAHRTQNDIF